MVTRAGQHSIDSQTMRIISGKWRGRRLSAPKGSKTRPTADRTREALFSILGGKIEDATVLDLFAGTGSLGLECLSRGANHATFVEKDPRVAGVLSENLQLAPAEHHRLLTMPAQKALRLLDPGKPTFDLVFLDPPYHLHLLQPTFTALLESGIVKSSGTVVCEHFSKDSPPSPSDPWCLRRTRRFGEASISFFDVPDT